MMRFLLFPFFLLCYNLVIGQILFEQGSWDEVLVKSKSSNKLIFIDAYTTWCGPCKSLAKTTFKNDSVGDFVNTHFIPLQIDMEKGEGIDFAEQYGVHVYPTLLFINGDGELIHKSVGFKDVNQFITLCEEAIDPTKQLKTILNELKNGPTTKENSYTYLHTLYNNYEYDSLALISYWNLLTLEEKCQKPQIELLVQGSQYFKDFDGWELKFFLENRIAIINNIGYNKYADYYDLAYQQSVRQCVLLEEINAQERLTEIDSIFPDKSVELMEYYAISSIKNGTREKEVKDAMNAYKAVSVNVDYLNSQAEYVNNMAISKKLKAESLALVNRSIEVRKLWSNTYTKATILYDSKRYPEALESANESLALAKQEGAEIADIEVLIASISEELPVNN